MEVIEFITNKLEDFSKDFLGTKFSYVYDERYSQHIIEVIPSSTYNSEDFAIKQIKFELELINRFPQMEILFITEGHELILPKFELVIGEWKASETNLISEFFNLNLDSFFSIENFDKMINDIKVINSISVKLKSNNNKYYGGGEMLKTPTSISQLDGLIKGENKDLNILKTSVINVALEPEENSYALAA